MNVKELTFGSEEWLEELNNRVKFPSYFAIYYGINKETKDKTLQPVLVQTKSKDIQNIRLGSISKTFTMTLTPYKWLLIDVYQINSAEDYLSKMRELANDWDVYLN